MSAIWRRLVKYIPLLSLLIPIAAIGQTDAIQGHCTLGGTKALVSGLGSTNYQQGIIPGCTVSVYLTGTTTLATIYSNSTGTALANPFTAVLAGSPNPGYWIFYAATGQGYDVKLSGGGGNPLCTTAPNCYTVPLTYTDLKVGGTGGGGGGLTFFSAGNNPPLFNTTVTNPGTTPNLAFNPINQSAQTVFGNFTGASAQPFFAQYACTGLLGCTYNAGTNTWTLNVPATSTLSVTATGPIRVNGGTGPVSSGTANIDCPTCTPNSIDMQPTGLPAGQHALIYPTGATASDSNPRTTSKVSPSTWQGATVYQSGTIFNSAYPTSFPPALGQINWTFTGSLAAEAPWINPANITSIVAFTKSGNSGSSAKNVVCGSATMGVTASTQMYDQNAATTGLNPDVLTCSAQISDSLSNFSAETLSIGLVGFAVYYTGTAPPVDSSIAVAPPLTLINNQLSVDPSFPQFLNSNTVAELDPCPQCRVNQMFLVNDYTGTTTGTCVGGGTFGNLAIAVWNTTTTGPTAWTCVPIRDIGTGGGGGVTSVATGIGLTGGPITTTGTISCVDSTSSTKGCVQVDGTTITATGGVISAPGGGGGLSGQTPNYVPKATTATTSTGPSIIEDQGTGIVVHGTSTTHAAFIPPSTGTPTPVATDAGFGADSSGNAVASDNGGAFARVCTATNGVCAGGGGTPLVSRVSCVTYGCTADGNLVANTGTDNTTAFTNCLNAAIAAKDTCYIPAGTYRVATSMPTINVGNTGFVGDIWGLTTVFSSSTTATILTISSGTSSYIEGDHLENITLARGGTGSGSGAIALLMDHAAAAVIKRNYFTDSATGVDITNSPAHGVGIISHNSANWGYSGVTCATAPLIGFNLHGSTGGFGSMRMEWNTPDNNSCGGTSYGFKSDGAITDLMMDHNETAKTSYGIYFVGSSGQDVHIDNQIDDTNSTNCEYFDFSGVGNNTTMNGGWCESTHASAGGTVLHNVKGVTISNRQYYDGGGSLPDGITINTGSTANSIVGNNFYQPFSRGIVCNAANANTATGNTFNMAGDASEALDFTNCSNWTISGNSGINGGGTVVKLDASSNNNKYINLQTWQSSGTAISDAGTGNQFSGGIPYPGAGIPNSTGSAWGTSYSTTGTGNVVLSASPALTGTPDASGATQFKLPVAASGASLANGELIYDSTNGNWHGWVNGADTIFAPLASGFTSGHCGQPQLTGSTWYIADAGGACGVAGGGAAFSAITSGSNTTATMTVGTGASIVRSGTGTIDASKIGGVTISGTPSAGQVPVASSSSAAAWGSSSGALTNLTGSVTVSGCTVSGNVCTANASTNAVTFSAIPGTYNHLRLDINGSDASQTANGACFIQFNSDTGAHYNDQYINLNGTTPAWSGGGKDVAATSMLVCDVGGTAVPFSQNEITIPFYSNTALQKAVVNPAVYTMPTSSTFNGWYMTGNWTQTSAITSITVSLTSAHNWATSSVFTLYGVN